MIISPRKKKKKKKRERETVLVRQQFDETSTGLEEKKEKK